MVFCNWNLLYHNLLKRANLATLYNKSMQDIERLGPTAWRVDVCFNAPLKLVIFLPKSISFIEALFDRSAVTESKLSTARNLTTGLYGKKTFEAWHRLLG